MDPTKGSICRFDRNLDRSSFAAGYLESFSVPNVICRRWHFMYTLCIVCRISSKFCTVYSIWCVVYTVHGISTYGSYFDGQGSRVLRVLCCP